MNGLQAAWAAKWSPSLGLTVVVGRIPDSPGYPAIQAYFQAAVAKIDGMKGKNR